MADPARSGSVRCLDTAAQTDETEQRNQGNLPGTNGERRTEHWLRCETGAGPAGWCLMSDDLQPLDPHETVDLDTGSSVMRCREPTENYYRVTVKGDSVDLEDEEIRQIAELAGYTVTDEPGDA